MTSQQEDFYHAIPAKKVRPLATLGQTEEEIDRIVQMLDEKIDELYEANEDKIDKLGDWLLHRDKCNLIAESSNKGRTSEDTRDSFARRERNDEGVLGSKLWKASHYAEGKEKNINTHIGVLKAQLSALQSKAKGIRDLT